MIISDGHKGIQKAVTTSFPGSSWQVCHVHLMRVVLKTIPKKYQKEVAEKIKEAMENPLQLSKVGGYLEERRFNKAIETLDRFHFDTHNYQSFPKEHWRKIRTTNIPERVLSLNSSRPKISRTSSRLIHSWSFQQIVNINSVLFMFAKNSGKVKNIVELVYSQNGSNMKAYILIGNYVNCS